jgi:hypothetical protein
MLQHVDPLLGNDREISNYTEPFASNGSWNKHVSKATIALQRGNGVFYADHAELL